jgi:2-haloacid dehalogenase
LIRNIVFDVGGVLVRLHYQPFVRYLGEAGIDMTDLPAWLSRVDLEGHERGEISGHELLSRIAATAVRPLDPAELAARWLQMFERWDEMFALATGLMDDYRVYLLSNVGDLHWAHLDERYGVDRLVHGAVASFRVGVTKPSPEIYRRTEAMFGLDPAATVFIDDLPQNVAGARGCGWQAIRHSDARATRDQLRAMGVRLPSAFAAEV